MGNKSLKAENDQNRVLGLQVSTFGGTIRVIKSKSRNEGDRSVRDDWRDQGSVKDLGI